MTAPEIIALLRARRSPDDVAGQRRFGITPRGEQLGVRSVLLRQLAREHRRDHGLALELWASGIYDARQLAALVDDPKQVTEAQMEAWAAEFDNWATVDACCMHLFRKTPWAFTKARTWSGRPEEFVRRAGFTLMATLAVHAKKEPESTFLALLPLIESGAGDERNFVKKAVNWALRQIGKRSATLRPAAMATAEAILLQDTRAARWVARGALRELRTYVR
ncbi:MAG TPA: DNA alkylation repair protein [Opitutaceae bacterium]|nr:DNA alkylation repair protein [Opitutaceae bacterium]HOD47711.1 DNA alkylation repair protein [Opitutaceae bacterium]